MTIKDSLNITDEEEKFIIDAFCKIFYDLYKSSSSEKIPEMIKYAINDVHISDTRQIKINYIQDFNLNDVATILNVYRSASDETELGE